MFFILFFIIILVLIDYLLINMGFKLILFSLFFVSGLTLANHQLSDVPVTIIYSPEITIAPDQYPRSYPEKFPVKLLINEKGRVDRVFYPENTPQQLIQLIDRNMKLAKFTPYFRQGVAVKSIVPFTVKFVIQTEYDYNGELGD